MAVFLCFQGWMGRIAQGVVASTPPVLHLSAQHIPLPICCLLQCYILAWVYVFDSISLEIKALDDAQAVSGNQQHRKL
jgi:hypothetical protein